MDLDPDDATNDLVSSIVWLHYHEGCHTNFELSASISNDAAFKIVSSWSNPCSC
jgi:hypothetical protein